MPADIRDRVARAMDSAGKLLHDMDCLCVGCKASRADAACAEFWDLVKPIAEMSVDVTSDGLTVCCVCSYPLNMCEREPGRCSGKATRALLRDLEAGKTGGGE